MNENSNSSHIESDDFNLNAEEIDYTILIKKLKAISATITLLEENYLDKS